MSVLDFRWFCSAQFDVIMKGCWRTLLLIFLAPVLFISVVSTDQTSTCRRSLNIDELGRATVAAVGVFEGRLEALGGPLATSSSLFVGGQVNATFSLRHLHKGRFNHVQRASAHPEVVVRLDSTGDRQVPRTVNVAGCSVTDLLVLHQNYLVFVSDEFPSGNSQGQSGTVNFQATAFPVPSTADAVKQVRAYRCRKCGKLFYFGLRNFRAKGTFAPKNFLASELSCHRT